MIVILIVIGIMVLFFIVAILYYLRATAYVLFGDIIERRKKVKEARKGWENK